MAKTFVKKPRCWTDNDMENALKEVLSGQSSIRGAASRHGLNESSVRHRLKRLAAKKTSDLSGRTPTFSAEVEAALANNVQDVLNQGSNLKADEVLDLIAEYLHKNNIGTVFKEGRPGKDWLRSFLARNKLSLKKPSKDGQVVMTICKGCQELGPPPLAIPPGKKWTRAWALIDDPSFVTANNHYITNGSCPIKKEQNSFSIGDRYSPLLKNEPNHFVVDIERCDPSKNEQNIFIVNGGRSSPSKNEPNQFILDGGRNCPFGNEENHYVADGERNSPTKNEQNHYIIDEKINDITDEKNNVVEKNGDVDVNPTVYILNNADNIDIHDIEDGRLDETENQHYIKRIILS